MKNLKQVPWYLFVLVVVVIAAGGVFVFRDDLFVRDSEKIHIAVVAPITGDYALDGQDMLNGVNLCVDRVNQSGGINGKEIDVIEFDDQNNADLAEQRAAEIVADGRALAVIGHAFSSSSKRAGPIYEEAHIPAISGSATAEGVTEGRDWYFRVIPNGHSQAVFTANYLWHIMGNEYATVIYDTDAAGTSLAEPFAEAFQELGGTINYNFSLDTDRDVDEQIDNIVTDLSAALDGPVGAVFLAVKVPQGIELIVQFNQKGIKVPLYGSSSFANIDFIQGLKEEPLEKAIPGYYSDDVHTISPILFDVTGQVGQTFRMDFVEAYGEEPGAKAATNCDAALMLIHAMERAGISGAPQDRKADRQKIRDDMADISVPAEAIEGVTGNIYFDQHGNIVKSNYIGVYKHQALISALTQLQPIRNIEAVPDLGKAIDEGEVFHIDNQYMYKTDVVYTGIDFIEVSNLDTKDATYTMDFYLWFRYFGDADATKIEFINAASPISLGDPITEQIIDGENYVVYRIKSNFVGDFTFHDYPFDRQNLKIQFKHTNKTRDRIIYVVDFRGIGLTSGISILEKITAPESKALNLGAWKPEAANFYQDIMTTHSTLGNPNFFGVDTTIDHSRFNAFIRIKRDTLSFGLKNLLPLLAVTILSYLSVFLSVQQFGIKNAIGRGALLTVAFFHIKLSSDLPGIGYSVALDYAFYGLYTLIVASLILSVMIQSENNKENQENVRRLIRIEKVLYPVFIVIGVIWFSLRYGLIRF